MILSQALFILLGINLSFSMDAVSESNWKNLLHIHQETNEVVSPEWYISKERTLESEYRNFLNLINGPDAQFYACEFPARFKYVEKKTTLKSKIYLDSCTGLRLFKKTFDKKHVSLALTSEHLHSPASAFGHIMMVFHDETKVELNASVLHFSALTQNENFFRYATNGLSGIFSGYYFYEPFFKKLNEYSDIEQRSIFFHQLILTDEQKELLIYHLYELKKARFKYAFFRKNCGYQINNLLNFVYEQPEDVPWMYFLPRETLDKHKTHLKTNYTTPPLASRSEMAIKKLSKDELSEFTKTIEDGKAPENNLNDSTKNALYLYSKYLFRNKRIISNQFSRISNLNTKNEDENLYQITDSPIDLSLPRKVQAGITHSSKRTSYILSYRPVLLEASDFQYYKPYESTFNILKTELLIDGDKTSLNSLDILDVKLATPTLPYFREASWFVNSGLNRENFSEALSLSHSFGIGQTFDLGLKLSYYLGAGFDLENMDKGSGYLSGLLNSVFYIYKKNKIVHQSKFKFYKQKILDIHDISFIRDLKYFDIYMGYNVAKENRINMGIYYHF